VAGPQLASQTFYSACGAWRVLPGRRSFSSVIGFRPGVDPILLFNNKKIMFMCPSFFLKIHGQRGLTRGRRRVRYWGLLSAPPPAELSARARGV